RSVPPRYRKMLDCGDQMSCIPFAAIVVNSASPNAVPSTTAVSGAYRQLSVVDTVPSVCSSCRAAASVPSPQWTRYASVESSAKLAQVPSALAVEGSTLAVCTLSKTRSLGDCATDLTSAP